MITPRLTGERIRVAFQIRVRCVIDYKHRINLTYQAHEQSVKNDQVRLEKNNDGSDRDIHLGAHNLLRIHLLS
ncbi:hypothetical protein D3C84_1056300 [compost metagenome]